MEAEQEGRRSGSVTGGHQEPLDGTQGLLAGVVVATCAVTSLQVLPNGKQDSLCVLQHSILTQGCITRVRDKEALQLGTRRE